jgi:hypothetical protein
MNGSHIMKSTKFDGPILQSSRCAQRLNAPNGLYGLAWVCRQREIAGAREFHLLTRQVPKHRHERNRNVGPGVV